MQVWDDVITDRDRIVYERAGFGVRQGFGSNPAVLIIDVNYNFVGDSPEPILESMTKHRNSCGDEGWAAIPHIQTLLASARSAGVPLFYTTNVLRYRAHDENRPIGRKRGRWLEDMTDEARDRTQIVREIAPEERDIVIRKDKPSAFFGTNLIGLLVERGIDQLLIGGVSTSGCVRASVVDASSYNFHVAVIEECVFDRGQTSHKIALFDMNAKWADVITIGEATGYLESVGGKNSESP